MNERIFVKNLDSFDGKSKESKDADFEEFYRKHKKFFDHYAKDSSIEVKSHKELPESEQGTFCIDLKNGQMFVALDVFKNAGYGDEASFFAFLHEYEHFRELRELMDYQNIRTGENGADIWKEHYKKLLKSKGLQILDNCIDDIKMNRTVLDRAPTLIETKDNLYKTFNFPEDDLTKHPLHLQLAYALLRRRMLPQNKTVVDLRVEEIISKIENISVGGRNLIDVMTSPETNMANRLKLQEAFIEPEFLKLLEESKKEKQNNKGDEKLDKENKNRKNSSQEGEGQEGEGQEGEVSSKSGNESTEENKSEEEIFKDSYDEYEKRNPRATTIKLIDKSIKEYKKSNNKSIEEMQLEVLAKKEGLSVSDLKEYQSFWSNIENLQNEETGESVVEELRQVFKKIITKRLPPKQTLVSNLEEGNEIEDYTSVVTGSKTGNFETKIWQDFERKNRPNKMVGNFNVSFVCDRSGSMGDGEKAKNQRIAVGLFLEMLKEFSEDLDSAPIDLQNKLDVKTEVWGFGDENQVGVIKPLNEELSEKDRVLVYKTLETTPGSSTLDYRPLEEISNGLTDDDLEKIERGEQRKIVILVTDGVSSSPSRLRGVVEDLRQKGVYVIAIGLGKEADSITENYAPYGILCENPNKLGQVVGELLKDLIEKI